MGNTSGGVGISYHLPPVVDAISSTVVIATSQCAQVRHLAVSVEKGQGRRNPEKYTLTSQTSFTWSCRGALRSRAGRSVCRFLRRFSLFVEQFKSTEGPEDLDIAGTLPPVIGSCEGDVFPAQGRQVRNHQLG